MARSQPSRRSPRKPAAPKGGRLPNMVFSTDSGELFEHPYLKMAVHNGLEYALPQAINLNPIPERWDVMRLPDTFPVGYDPTTGTFEVVDSIPGSPHKPRATAIHPPPGFVRQHLPAAKYLPYTQAPNTGLLKMVDEGGLAGRNGLPLWAYTAVGWHKGGVVAAMFQADELTRWHPDFYYQDSLPNLVRQRIDLDPTNPVLNQLKQCAMDYKCCCAQNIFYGRWEAAIPMAPACNAQCLGCLSKDAEWDAPTPQKRLKFAPDGKEIGRVIAHHLTTAPEAMASFGQGCEGEPTLSGEPLVEGVKRARAVTKNGIIHVNTNGSRPNIIARAAAEGINSIRISVNTFEESVFEAYYRPRDYKLSTLMETLKTARDAGLYKCINLLIWPGWTDTPKELERLSALAADGLLDMIQLRNLCVDPAYYAKVLPAEREAPMGMRALVEELHRRHPQLRFGTFNPRLAAPWFEDVAPWVGEDDVPM